LIYYGFSHPHDPRNGKVDLLAKYGAVNHIDKNTLPVANSKQPKLPANYLPEHPFHHGHPNLRDEVDVQGVWKRRDEATIRNEMGREFACSENIDIQIGRVLKKLEEMGELGNTYIFYTADHGIAIGRHGLQGKQNLYEHTWRVPFIAKGPGIKTGRVQGNIYLLDILGTMCDLAGIKPPKTIESTSFRPVLEGKQQAVRDVMFGVYCGGTKPGMRSVKKGDWKLIKYDVLDGKVRQTQLFNLKDNPDELIKEHHDPKVAQLTENMPRTDQVNLADNPKYADKLAEMEALLLSEMKRHNDPYRLWDQPGI
jgi:choline-sulfatase